MHNEWEWIRLDWCFLSNKDSALQLCFRYFVILQGLRYVQNKKTASAKNSFTSEWIIMPINWWCVFITLSLVVTTYSSRYKRLICTTAALPQHSAVWAEQSSLANNSCHMSNTICMRLCLSLVCHSLTTKWQLSDMDAKPTAESGDMKCLFCASESLSFLCISCVRQWTWWWQLGGKMC